MEENDSLRPTHFERASSKTQNLNVTVLQVLNHYGVNGLASDLDLGLSIFYQTITEPLKIRLNSQLLSYKEIYW